MRIAIPVANGTLCVHFGHCQSFALIDVDEKTRTVLKKDEVDAPEHEPGLLPRWLAERGVHTVIAGGMGQRAQSIFAEHAIAVVVGASPDKPESVVAAYLEGRLTTGDNLCDH